MFFGKDKNYVPLFSWYMIPPVLKNKTIRPQLFHSQMRGVFFKLLFPDFLDGNHHKSSKTPRRVGCLPQPNPGYGQPRSADLHQPMSELSVCPDLTKPWIWSVTDNRCPTTHGELDVFLTHPNPIFGQSYTTELHRPWMYWALGDQKVLLCGWRYPGLDRFRMTSQLIQGWSSVVFDPSCWANTWLIHGLPEFRCV